MTVVALCGVVLALPYLAIASNALYCRHSTIFWNANECFKFALHGGNSQIVLVGDSSLVFGVRPNLIEQHLHVSAYNLGQPAGSMIFFPGLLLDRYLAHNRRPPLIILYVGPWTLLKPQPDLSHLWDDGARAALRHGSIAQIVGVFATDPRRLLRVPILVLQQGLRQFSLTGAWWRDASAELQTGRGWFAVWAPGRPFSIEGPGGLNTVPATLPDRCTLPIKPLGIPDRALIRRFRQRYEREGTRVLVYVAPVPRCDPTYSAISVAYSGISDNRPQTLPGKDFIDDGWRVHLTRHGARRATEQLSAFIASAVTLQQTAPAREDRRIEAHHT